MIAAVRRASVRLKASLLHLLKRSAAVPHHRARGCSPVFISYGHYPLSVIQYPDTRPFYAPDPAGPPPQRLGSNAGSAALRPVTLRTVLEKRRVQVCSGFASIYRVGCLSPVPSPGVPLAGGPAVTCSSAVTEVSSGSKPHRRTPLAFRRRTSADTCTTCSAPACIGCTRAAAEVGDEHPHMTKSSKSAKSVGMRGQHLNRVARRRSFWCVPLCQRSQ